MGQDIGDVAAPERFVNFDDSRDVVFFAHGTDPFSSCVGQRGAGACRYLRTPHALRCPGSPGYERRGLIGSAVAHFFRSAYFFAAWWSAKATPCGSMSCTIRPPGTSIAPFRTLA